MKKNLVRLLIAVLVIAGAIGCYIYFLAPEKMYCYQMANLCDGDADLVNACEDVARKLGETDMDAVRKAANCVAGADTCPDAIGCGVGVGLKVGAGQALELLEGVQRALE